MLLLLLLVERVGLGSACSASRLLAAVSVSRVCMIAYGCGGGRARETDCVCARCLVCFFVFAALVAVVREVRVFNRCSTAQACTRAVQGRGLPILAGSIYVTVYQCMVLRVYLANAKNGVA